jgi:outer membrane murein-binding lipoprotein Lpp
VTRRTMTAFALLTLVASGARAQTPAAPENERDSKALNLTAYAELLRSDVRAQKVAILTEVMGFTEKEDEAFWPIYREYDLEMSTLGDQRVAMIAEYAKHFGTLTDAKADELATKALDLEAARQALKRKFYERIKGAVAPVTAARFLQVEQQLLLLIDLQILSSLPIAPVTATARR